MDRPRFRLYFLHPRFWPLWLGLALLWLIVQLPYRALLVLGRLLGALMYRVAGDRRRIAARNLELCFPNYRLSNEPVCSRKTSPPPASPSSKWP